MTIILLVFLSLSVIAKENDSVIVLHHNTYEKVRMALNDVDVFNENRKYIKKYEWLRDFVETCDLNNKIILPLIVEEQVRDIYTDSVTGKRRTVIRGIRRSGLNDLFDTGQIVSVIMGDMFVDIDVRDNQMRFLGKRFFSPLGVDKNLHYNIEKTAETDSTVTIHFTPKDRYDLGFVGNVVLSKDSSLNVRSVHMGLPKKSMVNYIDTLDIHQTFKEIKVIKDSITTSHWVLDKSTLMAEMSLVPSLGRVVFTREQKFYNYGTDTVESKVMSGKVLDKTTTDPKAEMRDTAFWLNTTMNMSTGGNGPRPDIIRRILGYAMDIKGLRPFAWLTKALIDNYIPTSTPSYFDIGPVTSLISRNDVDKFRLRFGGETTANFNKHLFLGGYYAHGFKYHKNYYDARITYSFNPKQYSREEYPRRYISFESSYDICFLNERYLHGNKDNIFRSFKWHDDSKMIFYNQQELSFGYETDNGWRLNTSILHDIDEATGCLVFKPLSEWNGRDSVDIWSIHNGKITLTELQLSMEYSPGAKYFNTRYRQLPVNDEMPVIGITHTWGIKNFLGGQYNHHATEAHIYKRFFLGSWGITNVSIKGGGEWCRVPYPLLISPASNLSFVYDDNSFHLCNTSEFVSDRYVQLLWSWEMNGKIFNLIPYVRNFKLREFIGIRAFWGWLSSKNDPRLPKNANSDILMAFSKKMYTLDRGKPYLEGVIGIHNIINIFNIDYVYRFDYMHFKDVRRSGFRFSIKFQF